jgi:hypothetical protein
MKVLLARVVDFEGCGGRRRSGEATVPQAQSAVPVARAPLAVT